MVNGGATPAECSVADSNANVNLLSGEIFLPIFPVVYIEPLAISSPQPIASYSMEEIPTWKSS